VESQAGIIVASPWLSGDTQVSPHIASSISEGIAKQIQNIPASRRQIARRVPVG
jgi:hypothetical protein